MFIIGLALCPLSLSAVPFAASLDQSVPCPRELSSVGTGFGALTPVHVNASAALAREYLMLPALLEATRAVLHAPSASMIAVSNGAAVWESYAGTKYANGTGGAPTRDTAYRIASLTKVRIDVQFRSNMTEYYTYFYTLIIIYRSSPRR